MEPARGRTTSAEGVDIYLKDLDTVQLLLPPGDGDSASPELAIEASSSYPCTDLELEQDLDQHLLDCLLDLPSTPELAIDGSGSPNIDWAALENIPLYTDTCLEVATIQAPGSPSILPSDEMSGSDLNEPLHRDNTCLQVEEAVKEVEREALLMIDLASLLSVLEIFCSSKTGNPSQVLELTQEATNLTMQAMKLRTKFTLQAMKLALQAVGLNLQAIVNLAIYLRPKRKQSITHVSSIPRTNFNIDFYEEAIREILQVLRAACIIHKLPLAQTWATCAQQGKHGKRHSHENYRYCISTIDAACYVNDPRIQIFHEACSEHHLLPGQGVAGKAFATNQPCFLPDIGSSSEQEYPLSDKAKHFKLKGAMAIRVRCTRTGTTDFVLEFFLPADCEGENEQNALLNSLSGTMQCLCRTLRMVTDKEMHDDPVWGMNELNSFSLQKNKETKRRKPMEPRSPVWKSFTKVMAGDTVKAKCNYCGKTLCCDSKNGTSSLAAHLKRCKLNPDNSMTGPI